MRTYEDYLADPLGRERIEREVARLRSAAIQRHAVEPVIAAIARLARALAGSLRAGTDGTHQPAAGGVDARPSASAGSCR